MTLLRNALVWVVILGAGVLLVFGGMKAWDAGLVSLMQPGLGTPVLSFLGGVVTAGLLALLLLSFADRRGAALAQRREQQADTYGFFLTAWANVLHLPSPGELEGVPDEVQDIVADANATLQTAERQLQLHGGRRVLREYRALQEAGEITEELVINLVVEMRRDLGLSVYSELRNEPLGFDLDALTVRRTTAASPARNGEAPRTDGPVHRPPSSAIASSIHRS